MRNFLIIVILSIVFVASGFAQGQPKASLIDEFQNPNCEDIWARLDNFLIQLNNNPDSTGTIAISAKANDLRNDLYYESMIRIYFVSRRVASERWKIIRTPVEQDRKIKFWLTPVGGELPEIQVANWSLQYPEGTKPFIFFWGASYESDVCLQANEPELLSKVLEANPNARTNVVLLVRSQKEFDKRRQRTIRMLTSDYSIRKEQIRIFKKLRSKRDIYSIDADTEYWLVP